MQIKIDGTAYAARDGETVLSAARRHGVAIPTLCHHEAVEGYGGCRLCVVEIGKEGRTRLVVSCLYPVEEGLEVRTASPKVLESRRTTLELLLARCPDTPAVRKLAAEAGVKDSPFHKREKPDACILCGLCVRICQEQGFAALSLANRGNRKEVATPYHEGSAACVGCGACARSCPTGAIAMEEGPGYREIWKRRFELVACKSCGKSHVTREQVEALCRTKGFKPKDFETCDDCRRKAVARTFGTIASWKV
ncbi:MAG: 2Fe-2S iron-sulfur cluster-binding protein [Planctomycetes bacterium]|jgi:NADH dehydrogenase/NADH:ubiquinone oxidoreductase subunit G|nr:2Fe-2S iron-sulfur cluster-binding protein [Planctomycetota bacterium]